MNTEKLKIYECGNTKFHLLQTPYCVTTENDVAEWGREYFEASVITGSSKIATARWMFPRDEMPEDGDLSVLDWGRAYQIKILGNPVDYNYTLPKIKELVEKFN